MTPVTPVTPPVMRPRFNTTGPCFAAEHYMLPPERRLGRAMELIQDGLYFTLHAGRQTGKTTSAQWLAKHYNEGERLSAMWVDLETAREEPDPKIAFRTILNMLDMGLELSLPHLAKPSKRGALLADPDTAVLRYLQDLSARTSRPLVVLFDEADGLVGATMVSFLTQLRAGYLARGGRLFPHSVALIGQRAVRDFIVTSKERRAMFWLGTVSPFNVTAEAMSLGPFTEPEVEELLSQHTHATGQPFLPEAIARIHALSGGHPWLVNALADQITRNDVRDRAVAVTPHHVESAKETIIKERRSHIDSLVNKLREPRVKKIVDAMLTGSRINNDTLHDDLAYAIGLGIVCVERGQIRIANPVYREVIPRALSFEQQTQINHETAWYVSADGSLDMPTLMTAFQTFWREDGHLAAEGFGYKESGPHLMLMAFLQRVVNGGGRVEREYGLGRGALDLLIEWKGQKHVVEVKLRRSTQTEARALEQVVRYLDHVGVSEGWLVMFDPTSKQPWSRRLTRRTRKVSGKTVHIVGC